MQRAHLTRTRIVSLAVDRKRFEGGHGVAHCGFEAAIASQNGKAGAPSPAAFVAA